ncbi:MAG: hypothetical protein J3Q66DRAFT_139158 [Benniella sp.]|nr:MAG: hypothetical protein J3Q66DRAFT_139158 [Benniella sp.]
MRGTETQSALSSLSCHLILYTRRGSIETRILATNVACLSWLVPSLSPPCPCLFPRIAYRRGLSLRCLTSRGPLSAVFLFLKRPPFPSPLSSFFFLFFVFVFNLHLHPHPPFGPPPPPRSSFLVVVLRSQHCVTSSPAPFLLPIRVVDLHKSSQSDILSYYSFSPPY